MSTCHAAGQPRWQRRDRADINLKLSAVKFPTADSPATARASESVRVRHRLGKPVQLAVVRSIFKLQRKLSRGTGAVYALACEWSAVRRSESSPEFSRSFHSVPWNGFKQQRLARLLQHDPLTHMPLIVFGTSCRQCGVAVGSVTGDITHVGDRVRTLPRAPQASFYFRESM